MIKVHLKFCSKQHTVDHMIQAERLNGGNSVGRLFRQGKYRAPYNRCSQQAPILQSSDLDFSTSLHSETEVLL